MTLPPCGNFGNPSPISSQLPSDCVWSITTMVKPPFTGFDLLGFTQMCHRQHPSLVELRSSNRRCSNSSRSQSCIVSPTVGQPSSTSTSSYMASLKFGSQCSTEDSDFTVFLTPPTSPSSPSSPTTQASMKPHIHQRLEDQTPTQSDDEITTVISKERRVLRRSVSEEPTSLFRTSSAPISALEHPPMALPTFSMEDLTRHLAEIYLIMGEPVDPRVWEDPSQDSPSGCDPPPPLQSLPNSKKEVILQTPVPSGPPPPKPPRLKDRVSFIDQSNNTTFKKSVGISKSLSHLPNYNNSEKTNPVTATKSVPGGGLPLFPSEIQRGVEPYQSPLGSPKAESFFTKLKKHRTTLRRKSNRLGRSLTIGHPSRFQHLGTGIESVKNFVKDDGRDSLDSLSHDEDDSIPEEKSLEFSKSDGISSDEDKVYKCFKNTYGIKKSPVIYTDDCKTLLINDKSSNEKNKVDSNENLSDDAKHEKAKKR